MTAFLEFCAGDYTVTAGVGALPPAYDSFARHALLHEEIGLEEEGALAFFSVQDGCRPWPDLVVALRFDPPPEAGFHPGFMLLPEHQMLFVGAGTRLFAYGLAPPRRLWSDEAEMGFWGFRRHGEVVLMSAELALCAWDSRGRKLWSCIVEPPWHYDVGEGQVTLDVMGMTSRFPLLTGPAPDRR